MADDGRKYLITENEYLSMRIDPDGHLRMTRDNGDIVDVGVAVGPAATDADVADLVTGVGTATAAALVAGFAPVQTPPDISPAFVPYDRMRSLYNFKPGHLLRTRAKLGGAVGGVSVCEVACVGDSITAGQTVTTSVQAWPRRLADQVRQRTGVAASSGWVVPFRANGLTITDQQWTVGTGWGQAGTFNHFAVSTTVGAVMTFLSIAIGSTVELLYSDKSGPFTVAIDGASPVTVTPGGTSALKTYVVTGLTASAHSVVIKPTSTTQVYVCAARVRYAAGLSVSNWGYSFSQASDWNTTSFWLPTAAVITTAHDLVFLAFGANEVGQGTPPATYKANLGALVDKHAANGSDVVLVAPTPLAADMTDWRAALFELAREKDVPVLDLFDRWVSNSVAAGLGMYNDGVHPSVLGYADIGLAVTELIV